MAHAPYRGIKISGTQGQRVDDELSLEFPLSILLNKEAFTVTMQSPGDEEDLIIGLLNSEGLLGNTDDPPSMEVVENSKSGYISKINVNLPLADNGKLLNSRSLLSVSSCGICGQKQWQDILKGDEPLEYQSRISATEIRKMFEKMEYHQSTFQKSGGSHAAGIFGRDYELLSIKEDIGRHNAVDKAVGALIRSKQIKKASFLLVSGRISYEIVVKCFKARIPIIAAVSAPSSLAVDYAEELGITLLAFCRGDSATAYSRVDRLLITED